MCDLNQNYFFFLLFVSLISHRFSKVVSFTEATRAIAQIGAITDTDVQIFQDGFYERRRLTGGGIFLETSFGTYDHCMPGSTGGCCSCGGTYDTGTEIVNFFLQHPLANEIEPVPRGYKFKF